MIAKPLAAQDHLPNSKKGISETLYGWTSNGVTAESLFFPSFISPWCMSKYKRCFDLVLGVFALMVLSPLMLLIVWLIKLTSQGPALFRQERIGLHQKTFIILKFRTMENGQPIFGAGPTVTRHSDARMTRVGRLLRRLKLDELPQLINVVRGEMSFVGPRPKIAQHENLSMLCRPGITGAASIEFSNEELLLEAIPEELLERYAVTVLNPKKCKLDVEYMETARFATDLRILIHTLFMLSNHSRRALETHGKRTHEFVASENSHFRRRAWALEIEEPAIPEKGS